VTSGDEVEQFVVQAVVACNSASEGSQTEESEMSNGSALEDTEISNRLSVTKADIVNDLRRQSQHKGNKYVRITTTGAE